ncbi:MAG TPA: cysteine dioxygenase family protein [Thermoanaerobaculia bacterium]|nr:cysteine dioxygenase family protein [Thermoanaerobaculia bacterium]
MKTTTSAEDSALRELVASIDEAVALPDAQRQTAAIKRILSDAIRSGGVPLGERFYVPKPDCYARRLLHRDVERGWSAVVMTWGPGQGTPLHDHAGIWCVEGTVHGEMEVIQYEIADRDANARYRFEPRGRVRALPGASGALIPPFEYHVLRNALDDAVSVTLHVYGGEMDRCHVFEPEPDGWHRRERKPLHYDA